MKFSLDLNGKKIEVENKNLAEQANGNIFVSCGETVLMSTCTMSKTEREGIDFFPLTVEYEEKYYASGKIMGSRFIKRENRPSDEAICNGRLIDRTIRPRFDQDIANEIQVIATVFSWDEENDPDVLGMISASLALSISDIPWNGPISAVRVIKKDGKLILNPDYKEREGCELDIIFAGVQEGNKILVNMIEGGSEEVEESLILEALEFAKKPLKAIIDFQKEITEKIGKQKIVIEKIQPDQELEKEINEFLADKLEKAIFQKDKVKRSGDIEELEKELVFFIEEKYPDQRKEDYVRKFVEKEIDRLIHEGALKHNKRADGRKMDEVREIKAEVGLLPRTHGSGLFCRGKTKGLSLLTLGTPGDYQLLDGMEGEMKKRFMHHYNFPPYSVGETKPMRGPGRREIGHGLLAEKALLPILPNFEDFPYTIRIVSEMLSSNGSTSMASVSSSSLALMDAGVPIKGLVTGIAIGLCQDNKSDDYKILTDIQGPEDHHGDMDFKIAGTKKGITAIQLDIKVKGISDEIIKDALLKAKKARLEILEVMEKTISEPRKELSKYAVKIETIKINPEKIGEVIGPGGRIINEIIDNTGAEIDIEENGLIYVSGEKDESVKKAIEWIKNIIREVEVGEIFEGKVVRVLDFGAFVEILPGQDGLIHISKLAQGRVEKVEDVVNIDDIVSVEVIAIDDQKRINLRLIENKSKKR
ncbi:MAG: polyribonucleotide nucleotidyltransferase [Candidatus Nealsonbacteria bacterium]